MNKVEVFNFETNDVRTVVINSEAWFVGKDVADALGYTKSRNALTKHVDEDDALKRGVTDNLGRLQETTLINESGVYSLIFGSKLENAKRFKKWVTSEVLPAIRKHGAYMTDKTIEDVLTNPDTIIRLATDLKNERQAKVELQQENSVLLQQNNEMKPKADYTDLVLSNKALVNITFIAKDYGLSGLAMNKLLHQLGVQYNQSGVWLLYAKHQKKGWTQSETKEVDRKDGTKKLVMNTKWTQKGRLGLYNLLKVNGYLPVIEQDQTA
ncbi:phage repressor protein/antirepressor Ant [Leuconostoc citreum]|uniref:phage repressor protein/antirepressor Ant n=1 Tax=Leuconostoc citreum TaxID=33964 RepID=UPI0002465984|nr:phage repressor protein/antirepressor Ant [Leuconostoc citreum]MBU7449998.1 phage repressor protein/antirepressor Ant [Leuconostoc citreum]CCF28467.1 Prophage antirepressor [Leuconostoc citreum LBAE E16]